jgi:phosphatidylserine decarboxylase
MPNSKGKAMVLEAEILIKTIYRLFIETTNRKTISRLLVLFSKSKISKCLIPAYSKIYQINETEMEKPLHEYNSLYELFTRKLKSEVRTIVQEPTAVISPVDATIQDCGTVSPDRSIIVKGKDYSISEMLGGTDKVQKYINGTYLIFYLSPKDYHRIHSPISGKIVRQWKIGSKSYPVNHFGLKYGKRPLSKNYRMITEIDYDGVTIAMVKVGAMFINSIELLTTEMELKKGEEMALFSFGSTVVLLFEEGTFVLKHPNEVKRQIKVGECIGYLTLKKNK